MAIPEDKKPIYDEKVKEILKGLSEKSREELSNEMGYSTWKSLDIYMRRKNFKWNGETYIPDTNRVDEILDRDELGAPAKVSLVMKLFSKDSSDPKVIAKQTGFKDHKELAEYMKSKGYIWSSEKGNYIKEVGVINQKEIDGEIVGESISKGNIGNVEASSLRNTEVKGEFSKYLPILEYLYENEDRLIELISKDTSDGTIPRYAIPGDKKSSSIYMSQVMFKLLGEFSVEKNIPQKEIVEGALIEYFKKYGFSREMDAVLSQN